MPTPQSGILPDANSHALFVVLSIRDSTKSSINNIRHTLSTIPAQTKALANAHPDAQLSSTISIGDHGWDILFPSQCPANLHSFVVFSDNNRHAPATSGDLFLHIRSERQDINFALMQQIMVMLGDAVNVEEDVSGFRYMDKRDLTGFVDGTENPEGDNRAAVAIVGEEDSTFAGGTYIHTQRYIHQLNQWTQCPVHQQERIIGRTKEDNVEFSSEEKSPDAHIKRVNLKDTNGKSMEILRHSMPYGNSQEAGLFFISYCRTPENFERMLEAMICADGGGHYDHLMNFSHAVSGCAFFAPSVEFLESCSK